jgi:hypothetical protein
MSDILDLEKFRLQPDWTALAKPSKTPPRHKTGEWFLKGPIPWRWLETAMGLPGKTLHVALLLWREAGCRKNRTVKLCLRGSLPHGLNQWSARRAIRNLEASGLVNVVRRPGHGLEVTLLDYPSQQTP